MTPVIASIISGLIANGLPKVADAVIDKGVDYVQDKLGVQLKPEGEASKDDYARLKEAALKHDEFITEQEVKDKMDARDMAKKAMQSDDPFVRRFTYFFITFWSIFAACFIPAIIWLDIPNENQRFADTVLGLVMGTIITSMFSFLLGSSFGSRLKDDKK